MLKLVSALILLLDFSSVSASVESVSVFVNEGDPVTLDTDANTNENTAFKWYFNNSRIAEIADQIEICTENQCKERFSDRLKVDNQTGSLTITNTRKNDSGEYELAIIHIGSEEDKIFTVSVRVVSASEHSEVKRVSVKEGESVTLDLGVKRNTNDVMTWYFNDIRTAKITGDQIQICADDQCKERFRDRLEVDPQTGSLNITNITTKDSGEYRLQISNRFFVSKRFEVGLTARVSDQTPDAAGGISAGGIAGIVFSLIIAAAVICGVIIYCRRRAGGNGNAEMQRDQPNEHEQAVPLRKRKMKRKKKSRGP